MNNEILLEINLFLERDEGRVGDTYRLITEGVTESKEIVARGGGGNTGAVYNSKQVLKALQEGYIPTSSSICVGAARTVRRLVKSNPNMSKETLNYLFDLETLLNEKSADESAIEHDLKNIDEQSEKLSIRAKNIVNAIYVYSFPTYIHFGTIGNPDLVWMKIGRTMTKVMDRVVSQNRETAMPEDPKLLRIYHKENIDLADIETKFHSTLRSVGHEQSSYLHKKAGNEWFATSLEALDALAKLMNLEIEKNSEFEH